MLRKTVFGAVFCSVLFFSMAICPTSAAEDVTWKVQWSTTDGQYGSFTFEIDSIDNPSIYVAELFAYLVAPPS